MRRQYIASNVFLYPANICTYMRFLLLAMVPFFWFSHPIVVIILTVTLELFDPLDGYIARKTGKLSALGQVLDMLVDRSFVVVVSLCSSLLYPRYFILFLIVCVVDVASHLALIYTCAILQLKDHKKLFASSHHSLLRYYYSDQRAFMFIVCLCYDLVFGFLYLLNFYQSEILLGLLFVVFFIGLVKFIIHLLQVKEILCQLAAID